MSHAQPLPDALLVIHEQQSDHSNLIYLALCASVGTGRYGTIESRATDFYHATPGIQQHTSGVLCEAAAGYSPLLT